MNTGMNTEWGIIPASYEQEPAVARVINCNRGTYKIAAGDSQFSAVLPGRLRHDTVNAADLPVIGDWVTFEQIDDRGVITRVLPRRTVLSRKTVGASSQEQPLAAHVDVVCIVMGLDGGRNYTARGLERYLTIGWNSGATPVVILNKADVAQDPHEVLIETEVTAPGVKIILTSAVDGTGVEELRETIGRSRTAVLIGPSGVGKSALTNALLGEDVIRTNETRKGDKRGRHTTTNSRMYRIPGGGLLIDAPGLKELHVWGDTDGVDAVFEEITAFARGCRFSDCAHDGEPGCAVQEALQTGELSEERYLSYLELRRELEFLATRTDARAKHQEHLRQKKFGKMVKDLKKHHPKYHMKKNE